MQSKRPAYYNRPLAWFSAFAAAWVFLLVTLGALTTSIGAGMAFSDWPLSNGSLNPPGWLSDIAMFSEHSHRLTGATMGLITLALAIWIQFFDSRAWLRRLAWFAVALVIVQGIIGGQRVRLDAIPLAGFEMTLGQLLRIPHGILAQVFVCILAAIAVSLSKNWFEPSVQRPAISRAPTILSRIAIALLFIQLVVAATMRHNHAGLAIPTFPLTPEGGLIPAHWDYRVALAFAHRALAMALTVALIALAISGRNRIAGGIIITLLCVQITLGALSVWNLRDPLYTTAHVVCGASLLAATFAYAWWLHRAALEGEALRGRSQSSATILHPV